MYDTRAEAERLIRAGLRVWPVGPNKKPTRPGFARKDGPEACAAPHEFARADVAVLAGPCALAGAAHRLVLLDLDGPVPDGEVPASWPPTLTAKGGAHRWYLVPKDTKAWRQTARVKAGEGWAVDTRDWGGYGKETKDGSPLWDNWGVAPAVLTEAQCAELFGAVATGRAAAVVLAKTAPPSVQGQDGSGALWAVALDLVRGYRLSPGEAHAIIMAHYNPRCVPPWSEAEVSHKVHDALANGKAEFGYLAVQQPEGGYLLTEKGSVKACFENTTRYIRAAYPDLRWDEVGLVAYDGAKRVDVEALSGHVRSGAAVAVGLDPSKGSACDAIVHVARERGFNRTRDALEALPRWDGRRRLDRWLCEALGAADSEYTRAVGRAWLVSAMARAFSPGCKADHLLLLEGGQGIGKSTALSILGGDGYKDLMFSAHDKDAMQDLRGRGSWSIPSSTGWPSAMTSGSRVTSPAPWTRTGPRTAATHRTTPAGACWLAPSTPQVTGGTSGTQRTVGTGQWRARRRRRPSGSGSVGSRPTETRSWLRRWPRTVLVKFGTWTVTLAKAQSRKPGEKLTHWRSVSR
jgi:hypothetical protein